MGTAADANGGPAAGNTAARAEARAEPPLPPREPRPLIHPNPGPRQAEPARRPLQSRHCPCQPICCSSRQRAANGQVVDVVIGFDFGTSSSKVVLQTPIQAGRESHRSGFRSTRAQGDALAAAKLNHRAW